MTEYPNNIKTPTFITDGRRIVFLEAKSYSDYLPTHGIVVRITVSLSTKTSPILNFSPLECIIF